MGKKALFPVIAVLMLSVLMASCLPGDGKVTPSKPAGFFWGIWHGWVAPISLIGEIFFNKNLSIYEPINAGWTYDIGYYMAVISGFGGLSLAHRRSRSDRRR